MSMTALTARVPPQIAAQIHAAAASAQLSQAEWCRRALDQSLQARGPLDPHVSLAARVDTGDARNAVRRTPRIFVRVRPADHVILQARAAARDIPLATYASVLLRAHVGNLNPLPRAELEALDTSISELSAIGRRLSELARAVDAGKMVGTARGDLEALMSVCEGLRIHVKDLLKANLRSWVVGHVDDQR